MTLNQVRSGSSPSIASMHEERLRASRANAHSENKEAAERSVPRRGVRALRNGKASRPPAAPTPIVCAISNGDRKCLL